MATIGGLKERRFSLAGFRGFFPFIVLGVVILLGYGFYSHKETRCVMVNKVDMQIEISGGENGSYSTYHCRVYTDYGLYEIDQSGIIFAHPELIGTLKEGEYVNITSRGFNFPRLGIYRKIVAID